MVLVCVPQGPAFLSERLGLLLHLMPLNTIKQIHTLRPLSKTPCSSACLYPRKPPESATPLCQTQIPSGSNDSQLHPSVNSHTNQAPAKALTPSTTPLSNHRACQENQGVTFKTYPEYTTSHCHHHLPQGCHCHVQPPSFYETPE